MTRFLDPLRRAARALFAPRPTVRRHAAPRLGVEGLEAREMPAMVFSLDLFEANVRANFIGNSVGGAYAINSGGQVAVRADGWGQARTAADGAEAFTENTRMTSASIAKQLTAVAIVKILQDTPGVNLDSPIGPYLPAAWTRGPNIDAITFRQLLTHQSGLRRIDFDASASDGNGIDWNNDGSDDDGASLGEQTAFAGLQSLVAFGIPTNGLPNIPNSTLVARQAAFSYENANFALMRVMVPYLLGDKAAADASATPNQYTADAYVTYVRDSVLAPMGIAAADTKPADPTPALNYNFPADGGNGRNYGDRTLLAGGEGWWLSATQWAAFLDNIRYDTNVISAATRNQMRAGQLGWMAPANYSFSAGTWGNYYSHGGDLNDLNTGVMDFPNGVQVALFVNSDWGAAGVPHGNAYQLTLLKRAWENAWTSIDLVGTAGDDEFIVQTNATDPQAIDIFRNGTLLATRWAESLDSLSLYGYGGNDTFRIRDLPAGVAVTAYGGANNDTLAVGRSSLTASVLGDITFQGGTGTDTLGYNDAANASVGGAYTLTADTFARDAHPSLIQYAGLEDVAVRAGSRDHTFRVNSTGTGTGYRLYGGGGVDTFLMGDGDLVANLRGQVAVDGQTGTDEVRFLDTAGGANAHFVIEDDRLSRNGFPGVTFASAEEIVLLGSTHGDRVDILNVRAGTRVDVFGNGGNDRVRAHRVAAGGELRAFGGNDNDWFEVTPSSGAVTQIDGLASFDGDEGADRLDLLDEYGSGAGNYTFGVLLGRGTFDATGVGKVEYKVERVELEGNNDANTIRVNAVPAGVELTVFGRGGDDAFTVGGTAADLDAVKGTLRLVGGADADTLRLRDSNDAGNDTYTLDGDTFTKAGLQPWQFEQMGTVRLDANGGNNTIHVTSLAAVGIDLEVNAGGGDDTIHIGGGNIGLIYGDVVVNGGAGTDLIHLRDENAPAGRAYTVGGGAFDVNSFLFGSVTYTSMADVVLHAGGFDDSVALTGTAAGTNLAVFANGGDDTINVGAGNLDVYGGNVAVHGGPGADAVTVNDKNDFGNDAYTVTATTVSKPGFLLTYQDVSTLTLLANGGSNVIDVHDTLPTTAVTIDGGTGSDSLRLAPLTRNLSFVAGPVTFRGGAGFDRVQLHDEWNGVGRQYTLSPGSIGRAGFGGLSYDAATEAVYLNMGDGNDSAAVLGLAPTTALFLAGNGGSDAVDVYIGRAGPVAGGTLSFNGGANGPAAGDRLTVRYAPAPVVDHLPAGPGAGQATLDYMGGKYLIGYENVELFDLMPL